MFLGGGEYLWDKCLDVIEVVSEESFWTNLLGERLYTISKRYFGNDTIIFCAIVSFLPAIPKIFENVYSYLRRIKEQMFYVSVVIGESEIIYAPIDEYLIKNFKGIHELRHVRGKTGYAEPNDNANKNNYYYHRQSRSDQENTPLIDLTPEKYKVFEINYKGYTVLINRKDETPTSEASVRGPFYNVPLKTDTIEIRMRSRNLPKLRSFIQEWIDEYYNSRKNKLIIYKCNFNSHGWDEDNQWKEHGFRKIRSFSSVVLKEGDQDRILNDIITFKDSKSWYNDRGIPYRRGYLLHGPPGTGKTSFIQSLASKVKMNVAILNLSAAANDDALSTALAQVPKSCILVIEDLDHYQFEEGVPEKQDGKTPPKEKNTVSVSGILNAIDGITSLEESIIFMTCNDINTIPPALIRPGRVDLKLHMGYLDNYQAQLIFWKFFCMPEKEKSLYDIERKKYPVLDRTVNELIIRIRDHAQQSSISTGIQLEISPAELISYLLFHALKFNLSKNPHLLSDCCQSLLEHIPDFISSVSADRIQAIEHAKKKSLQTQVSDSALTAEAANADTNPNKASTTTTTTTTTIITKQVIPTPPTSPASEKKTALEVSKAEG
ncbi:hypothetical protein INT47_004998 [Mucor saturninus]|uniref:P-loop containing nucleoside triphosphate hydrolase protein n=1 Tax=Mucor saturninus TaxID=64648 RepID=A0A8H7QLY4_9FUNG|nr:hypothetical protein INT47_004998 [Mucor saturninus]